MKTLQTGYIEGVNLARIVGAIGIIVFHYGCHNGILSPYLCSYANDSWGRVLVAVFLAISGACLARTYASDFEWKHYFGRRWKAIYPMFYLCYLFFFVEAAISVGTWWKSGIPYYRFVYTLLGIDGYIAPLQPNFSLVGDWFLGPIIICYLLFPALLWLLKRIPYATSVILLAGSWFIPYLPFFTGDPFQNLWTCVTVFYLGMLTAQSHTVLCSQPALWISAAILALFLFVKIPFYGTLHMFGPILAGIALFVTLVNVGRICERNKPVKSVLSVLGKWSYPIFLVQHIVILRVLVHWSGYTVATAVKGLLIAIVTSVLLAWTLTLVHERILSFFSPEKAH